MGFIHIQNSNLTYKTTEKSTDDIWEDGNYYVKNTGTPFENHGFLRVYSSGGLCTQEFVPFARTAGTYALRHKNYDTTEDWMKFITNADIQHGVSTGNNVTRHITFSPAFKNAPDVLVSSLSSNPANTVSVDNITSAGFDIKLTSGTASASWFAIAK